jgi:ParB/RepB/Spo0J family partition protein
MSLEHIYQLRMDIMSVTETESMSNDATPTAQRKTSDLTNIEISKLVSHPDNPRISLREDVVEQIAGEIRRDGFGEEHALLVRPFGGAGRYQIASGHTRREAARRAGLTSVPCWVREMSSNEALMQLVLSNAQGELSPLEIGLHALRAVPPAAGGRGQTGGLSEYAERIGRKLPAVSMLFDAAEVYEETLQTSEGFSLINKAYHLYEISRAPQEAWAALVEWLGDRPVKEVKAKVDQIRKYKFADDQSSRLPAGWLSLEAVTDAYLADEQPSPDRVKKLVAAASRVLTAIEEHPEGTDEDAEAFCRWLLKNDGGDSWREIDINRQHGILINSWIEKAEAREVPRPKCEIGQWWKIGRHHVYCGSSTDQTFIDYAKDAGATFAFADPPYNADAAEWDHGFVWSHDYLTEVAPIVAVTPGISAIAGFFSEKGTRMPYRWSMSAEITNGMTRGALGFGNWIYIALFSNAESIHRTARDILKVTVDVSTTSETSHKGRKPLALLTGLIELFTAVGDVVIDPFAGSGTTLFAAERTGRAAIVAELNPVFCDEILDRFESEQEQRAELL